jgi:hypothetical protein
MSRSEAESAPLMAYGSPGLGAPPKRRTPAVENAETVCHATAGPWVVHAFALPPT